MRLRPITQQPKQGGSLRQYRFRGRNPSDNSHRRLAEKLGHPIPTDDLPDISLKNLDLSFNTGSKAFSLQAEAAASSPLSEGLDSYELTLDLDFKSEVGAENPGQETPDANSPDQGAAQPDGQTGAVTNAETEPPAKGNNLATGEATPAKPRFEATLKGTLDIQGFIFEVTLNIGSRDKRLTGHWARSPQKTDDDNASAAANPAVQPPPGQALNLADLAAAHGLEAGLLDGLPLELEAVDLVFDFSKRELLLSAQVEHLGKFALLIGQADSGKWGVALGFRLDPLSTRSLPLVGDALQPHNLTLSDLRVLAASQAYQDALPLGQDTFSVARGVNLHGVFGFAQMPLQQPVELFLGGQGSTQKKGDHTETTKVSQSSEAQPAQAKSPATTTSDQETATSSAPKQPGTWLKVQKSIGPLTFQRVGFAWQNHRVWLLLDASLSMAGLSLDLDSFYLNFPLKDPFDHLDAGLKGLDLNFRQGPLTLNGGFLKSGPDDDPVYDGQIIVRLEEFELAALGSYTKVDGQPSSFIFVVLEYPLGGPSGLA